MKTFKTFITEAKKPKEPPKTFKDYLHPIPEHELLDTHLKFAKHGITLPDTVNLHKHSFNDKIAVQPLENGGHITYTTDHYWPGAHYTNAAGDSHREDGPSAINSESGEHHWHLNGVKVASWKPPVYSSDFAHSGWVRNSSTDPYASSEHLYKGASLDQTDLFNAHLAKHGFPPFDPTTIKWRQYD